MHTPHPLTAALGAGFYRYWHVPAPDAPLDVRDTRRADLSLIGPGAVALLAAGAWVAGRAGTALLLEQRLTTPLDALPWAARALVLTGVVGGVAALAWWLATAHVRARVARGVATGSVARIPDNPDTGTESLHAAATRLGRTLRDLPDPPEPADAFGVLRTAVAALAADGGRPAAEVDRLRGRCLDTAQALEGPHAHGRREGAGRPAAPEPYPETVRTDD